jgi:hypothetical protein
MSKKIKPSKARSERITISLERYKELCRKEEHSDSMTKIFEKGLKVDKDGNSYV